MKTRIISFKKNPPYIPHKGEEGSSFPPFIAIYSLYRGNLINLTIKIYKSRKN